MIGDFIKLNGTSEETGQEKFIRYTEKEIIDELDKIRKENGWKPRKRRLAAPSTDSKRGGAEQELNQFQLLQKLQKEAVDREKRRQDELEQAKLQKEAMR